MIRAALDALESLFQLGGPVVMLLGALSIVVMAVTLYKIWQFTTAGVGHHDALRRAVSAWDRGERHVAFEDLTRSGSYLRPVLALAMSGQCDAARLEAEAEQRFARLESGFRLLETIAQIAPLLGLMGTVLGMITAFQTLQAAGSQVDPSLLAGGIWVALLTTAVGLAVAMPATVLLSWFEGRMDKERMMAHAALRSILAPVAQQRTTDVAPGRETDA